MPAQPEESFQLVEPRLDRLDDYAAALETGWSPNTIRDVSGEQLEEYRRDPDALLRSITGEGQPTIRTPDGRMMPRLPGAVRWMWDGDFCGTIGLRYAAGTEKLPAHVSGHIGYSVVPWKQGRGYATHALRAMLPLARAAGLRRILATCDADNAASQRVIEKCGGRFAGTAENEDRPEVEKLRYWIPTGTD